MKLQLIFLSSFVLIGCSEKPNSKANYGESGLPKNCRALVQANVDMYRKLDKSQENYLDFRVELEGIIDSLERNCGANGYNWDEI